MMLLAIETSTDQLGVAVFDGARVLSSYHILAERPHAIELPEAVSRSLKASHSTLAEVDAIVVDIGPGSFTGLRIGVAFVKALAFANNLPTIGVPSLDVLAAQLAFSPRNVCPIMDAKRKNVYGALYQVVGEDVVRRSGFMLTPIEQVLDAVEGPVLFSGDGCALYREQILARFSNAQFAPSELWLPSAGTLARLGHARFTQGQRDEPGSLSPMYLYPQTCAIRLSNRAPGAPRKSPASA